jgi:hypothetical protein
LLKSEIGRGAVLRDSFLLWGHRSGL